MGVKADKYKFGARAGKYKLGARAGGQAKGQEIQTPNIFREIFSSKNHADNEVGKLVPDLFLISKKNF